MSAKPGSKVGSKSGKDFQEETTGTIKFNNLQRNEAKCNSPEKPFLFVWPLVVEKQEVEGGEA